MANTTKRCLFFLVQVVLSRVCIYLTSKVQISILVYPQNSLLNMRDYERFVIFFMHKFMDIKDR